MLIPTTTKSFYDQTISSLVSVSASADLEHPFVVVERKGRNSDEERGYEVPSPVIYVCNGASGECILPLGFRTMVFVGSLPLRDAYVAPLMKQMHPERPIAQRMRTSDCQKGVETPLGMIQVGSSCLEKALA